MAKRLYNIAPLASASRNIPYVCRLICRTADHQGFDGRIDFRNVARPERREGFNPLCTGPRGDNLLDSLGEPQSLIEGAGGSHQQLRPRHVCKTSLRLRRCFSESSVACKVRSRVSASSRDTVDRLDMLPIPPNTLHSVNFTPCKSGGVWLLRAHATPVWGAASKQGYTSCVPTSSGRGPGSHGPVRPIRYTSAFMSAHVRRCSDCNRGALPQEDR
jgi:hypothetical protein